MPTPFRGYPTVSETRPTAPDGRAQINALAVAVDADVQGLSLGMRLSEVVYYTSDGTFNKGSYPGLRKVMVECVGGGGGSGAAQSTSGSQISWGAGGAGGAYTQTWLDAGELESSETVTVGAGGGHGTSGTPDGGNGEDTLFGAHVTAGGGEGGGAQRFSTAASGSSFIRGTPGAPSGSYSIGVEGEGWGSVDFASGVLQTLAGIEGGAGGGPYGQTIPNIIGFGSGGTGSQFPVAGFGLGGGARGPVNITGSSHQDGEDGSDGIVIVHVFI